MRVFVTGATGFVGTAVVQELLKSGHKVLGLARSDASAKALAAAGAEVHRGDLEDLQSLRKGAESVDGVIHTGFVHDFARFEAVCEIDRRAVEAIGSVLKGSDRPLVVTSGTALVNPGTLANEDMMPGGGNGTHKNPRIASEYALAAAAEQGLRAMVVRLSPSVHGDGDHGFVPMLIALAREKGVSGYIGEGLNRWTGVHRLDAAVLYRLALEKGQRGDHFHGVDEEGVHFRDIAAAIGKGLNLPVESKTAEHFGWFAMFAGLDCPASSQLTRERLGWKPKQIGLLKDIETGTYFKK